MRVALLGLPYFARRVADQLAMYDREGRFDVYPFAQRPATRVSFLTALPRTDVVYYVGGGLARSRVVDLALALGKQVIMHWVGTDITNAAALQRAGAVYAPYVTRVRHLAEAPWTHDELDTIGVRSRVRPLVGVEVPSVLAPLPPRFTVVVYAPAGGESEYGVTAVIDAARNRPDTSVIVVGGAEVVDAPANVERLGWIGDMGSVLDQSTVLVRMVAHDGLSVSVLEALARARHVIYSQPLPETRHATPSDFVGVLDALRAEHAAGALAVNAAGAKFVSDGFTPAAVARGLLEEFGG